MAEPGEAPNGSPLDAGWHEPADTNSQASKLGVMHMGYGDSGQIDGSLPDRTAGHTMNALPLEDQTDTMGVEKDMRMPESFRRTTILEEKMAGGYTPNTAPVGEGTPAPTPTPGMRGAEDTEATMRLKAAEVMRAAAWMPLRQ